MLGAVANVRSTTRLPGSGPLHWQPSLLDVAVDEPAFDPMFATARRIDLDSTAWVEYVPAWVTGAAELFEAIVERANWSHRTVPMYGRMVEEPRLIAWYDRALDDPAIPPLVAAMAPALSERYDRTFDGVGAALYRDGRDSVAWHGDRIPEEIIDPVVALVSLGSPRTLRMRARHRRNDNRSFPLLPGDLFVMGGQSQRTWEHSVPKVARAGARLSVQFRHSH
jgi:alkylated DNA repair dioxygenase AlkB